MNPAPFAPGDRVVTFWQRKRQQVVEEVKAWHGTPSGWLVRLDGPGIPWIDAGKVKKAP